MLLSKGNFGVHMDIWVCAYRNAVGASQETALLLRHVGKTLNPRPYALNPKPQTLNPNLTGGIHFVGQVEIHIYTYIYTHIYLHEYVSWFQAEGLGCRVYA